MLTVIYSGILLWLGTFAIIGMTFIWILYEVTLLLLGRHPSVHGLLSSLGWSGWIVYAMAGLLLGIVAWCLAIQFIANRRVDRLDSKLKSDDANA